MVKCLHHKQNTIGSIPIMSTNHNEKFPVGNRKKGRPMYIQFERQLLQMIGYCLDNQKDKKEYISNISYKSLCKEFQTIKMCLPRQSGHTTSIKNIFKKFPNESVIFVPNSQMFALYREPIFRNKLFNINDIYNLHGLELIKTTKYIFVDCSSFIKYKDSIEELYCLFGYDRREKVFVFLE
jgi:hypothetical protein